MSESLRTKFENTDKKTFFMVGILVVTVALIVGLATGIATNQKTDNLRTAKRILENNVLIDGYAFA